MKNIRRGFDPLEGLKHVHKGIWFTWCKYQKGRSRIYCRLDRFYADKDFFSFTPNSLGNSVMVWPVSLSDHHPIAAHICLRDSTPPQTSHNDKFTVNTKLLEDQDILAAIFIIRQINRWNQDTQSLISRWNKNVNSWQCLLKTVGQKKSERLQIQGETPHK